ncbi:Dolichyl-diphosphooligosaccharide--protein glycosyltransferase subunit WBP1 [Dipodascopsis uninucleata]
MRCGRESRIFWQIATALAVALMSNVSQVLAKSSMGDRMLVITENGFEKDEFSEFLNDLEARGFELDFRKPNDPDLSLFSYGERVYDHIIFPQPSVSRVPGPNLLAKPLIDFVDEGGNILVLLHETAVPPTNIREFAGQMDIHLTYRESKLVDHFSYDKETSPIMHDDLILDPHKSLLNRHVADVTEPIKYTGQAMALGNSPLVVPVLRAGNTAYTYEPSEESLSSQTPYVAGTQAFLVAGMQARNNARVVIAGSARLFKNEIFLSTVEGRSTSNKEFALSLSKWVFQERGVLRLNYVNHKLVNTTEMNPTIYRVKQDISYEISISQYADDEWIPYIADDIQFEFTMIDPYYRLNLVPTRRLPDAELYNITFKAPDQHGMFSMRTNYKRSGLTSIDDKRVITLRHFGHDEFLRSFEIPNAWPYITSIVTVVIAWIAFVLLWIFNEGPKTNLEKKTK